MKPHLLLISLLTVGCGAAGDGLGLAETSAASELTSNQDVYLTLRRDVRRCASPLCGGYWAKVVNGSTLERYVSGLQWSASDLANDVDAQVSGAGDSEVLVLGRWGSREARFKTQPLIVTQAFRGMPGKSFEAGAEFFSLVPTRINCLHAPCPTLKSSRLNQVSSSTMMNELSLNAALAPLVDGAWLKNRVLGGRAVVAGTVVSEGGLMMTLAATQVFVALPDRTQSCPRFALPSCPPGKAVVWERNSNRCLLPAGCGEPTSCAPAACAQGYTEVAVPNACAPLACEPNFLQ
jgi:hypothetical protein